MIDWEGAKVVDRETNKYARWIKKPFRLRILYQLWAETRAGCRLSHVWDSLLAMPSNER